MFLSQTSSIGIPCCSHWGCWWAEVTKNSQLPKGRGWAADGWVEGRQRERSVCVCEVRKSFGRTKDKSLNDIEWLEFRIIRIIKTILINVIGLIDIDQLLVLDNLKKLTLIFLGLVVWFQVPSLGISDTKTSTDSHRRRQTSGPKPSGDCSLGSLADDFGGQIHWRILEFCQVFSKVPLDLFP